MTELSQTEKIVEKDLQILKESNKFLDEETWSKCIELDKIVKFRNQLHLVHQIYDRFQNQLKILIKKFQKRCLQRDPDTNKFIKNDRYRLRVKKLEELFHEAKDLSFELFERFNKIDKLITFNEEHIITQKLNELNENIISENELYDQKLVQKNENDITSEKEIEKNKTIRLKEAGLEVMKTITHEEAIYFQDRQRISIFINNLKDKKVGTVDAVKEALLLSPAKSALDELYTLISLIKAHPESEVIRKINALNPCFREKIISSSGGLELLAAIGFKIHFMKEFDENDVEREYVRLFLDEPNLSVNYDAWVEWYDFIKFLPTILKEKVI